MNFSIELSYFSIAILIIAILICIFLCTVFFKLGIKFGKSDAQKNFKTLVQNQRADAIKRSRSVLSGQMVEQIAPFLKDFPCNPADVRFIGKPIDFIGFPGAADGKEIQEILLIEVKTGSSNLSKREKEIKNLVENAKIRYVEYKFEN